MLKILISYNMHNGKERDCQEYLANKLAPGLARMGFQFSDIWFSMWGEAPQILGGGLVDDMDQARQIFLSSDWDELVDGLEPLAYDFKVRVYRNEEE
ncbi:MAG: hypothetical protein R3A44_15340 [Caldilineaceae bacterium]